MARFTPCVVLQVGGGFVNPLFCRLFSALCPSSYWEKSRGPRFWHLYYTRRQHVCPVHQAINLVNVKCIGRQDETKIWPDWRRKGLTFGPGWGRGGLQGEVFGTRRDSCTELWFICRTPVFPRAPPGTVTSTGVQNKHTLIGQLITGTKTGGKTLRGPLWLPVAVFESLRACRMFVCVRAHMYTSGKLMFNKG